MGFLQFSELRAIISLRRMNLLVSTVEMHTEFLALRTELLNIFSLTEKLLMTVSVRRTM
jgi:hypothetical protein